MSGQSVEVTCCDATQEYFTVSDFVAKNPALYDSAEQMNFSYREGAMGHHCWEQGCNRKPDPIRVSRPAVNAVGKHRQASTATITQARFHQVRDRDERCPASISAHKAASSKSCERRATD